MKRTKSRKPRGGTFNKLPRLVGDAPLPDTLGKRYAVENWRTDREPCGVVVAIAGKNLMLSRDDAARHLNDKDVTIDVLRRRCELLAVELDGLQKRHDILNQDLLRKNIMLFDHVAQRTECEDSTLADAGSSPAVVANKGSSVSDPASGTE